MGMPRVAVQTPTPQTLTILTRALIVLKTVPIPLTTTVTQRASSKTQKRQRWTTLMERHLALTSLDSSRSQSSTTTKTT